MPAAAVKPKKKASGPSPDDTLFRPALARVQANLGMLFGAPVVAALEPSRRYSVAEASTSAPHGAVVVVGAAGTGPENEVVIFVERAAALALACMLQMIPEAATKARLKEVAATDLTDAEREGISEIGNFMIAGLAEQVRELIGARVKLAQAPTKYLSGPTAVRADDCVGGEGYLGAVGTIKAGGLDEGRIVVLIPDALGKVVAAAAYGDDAAIAEADAASAGSDSSVRSDLLDETTSGEAEDDADALSLATVPAEALDAQTIVVGTGLFVERTTALLPPGTRVCALDGIGGLCSAADQGATPRLIVVEVPSGSEHVIEVTAALRRHPRARGAAFLLMLGAPTRQNVLRCGTTGLINVLPPEVPDDLFRRRLASLLSAASRAFRAS